MALCRPHIYSDILQNALFRSQIFEIFFASGGKGALIPLTKILRTFLPPIRGLNFNTKLSLNCKSLFTVVHTNWTGLQCLFQESFCGGGWKFLPRKLTIPPSTAAKLCALNLFFGRDNELQVYHGNFLLMDNKHMKVIVNKQ